MDENIQFNCYHKPFLPGKGKPDLLLEAWALHELNPDWLQRCIAKEIGISPSQVSEAIKMKGEPGKKGRPKGSFKWPEPNRILLEELIISKPSSGISELKKE